MSAEEVGMIFLVIFHTIIIIAVIIVSVVDWLRKKNDEPEGWKRCNWCDFLIPDSAEKCRYCETLCILKWRTNEKQ